MHKKPKAVEVIADKLWITYDSAGNKTGTLTHLSSEYSWLTIDGSKSSITNIDDEFDFERKTVSTWHQKHVFGYPIPDIETFKNQERDNLPCFTKGETSKVYYAAGYYAVLFPNNGWTESFCPKISTLRKHEFSGPFKTATDRDIVIQRKKREA